MHDLPHQGTEVQGAIWPRTARRVLNMMTGAACNCLTIFFHRMKSAPGGEKLLLITFPGKLQEIQQAASGRGRTCPASPRDPENRELDVLSLDLKGLESAAIPLVLQERLKKLIPTFGDELKSKP